VHNGILRVAGREEDRDIGQPFLGFPRQLRAAQRARHHYIREDQIYRYTAIDDVKELHGQLIKLKTRKSPFRKKVKDEAVTTWVKPQLVAEVKFTEWTSSGEMRHPVYLGLRADKQAKDVVLEKEKSRTT
jgi:hypothetical protein